MNASERKKVIGAYGIALENREYTVGKEVDLPYPKQTIKTAFACEIIENKGELPLDFLEDVYVEIDSWTDEESFNQITAYEAHLKNAPTSSSTASEIKEHASKMSELLEERENNAKAFKIKELQETMQATAQITRFEELREEGFKIQDDFNLNDILK